jgi:hypothetical protein
MSTRTPLPPERLAQLSTLKLVWLFVAEHAGLWPDQLRLSTKLTGDLGFGAVEGHRLMGLFVDEFPGARVSTERHFGPTPLSLQNAWAYGLLRRTLLRLNRMNLFPAAPGTIVAIPGSVPLTVAELCAAALVAKDPLLRETERVVYGFEHELNHWARHLPRIQSRRSIGAIAGLFNRSKVLNR